MRRRRTPRRDGAGDSEPQSGETLPWIHRRDWNEPNSSVAVFNTGTREFTTIVAIDDAHEIKDQLWAVAPDMSSVAYVL